MISLEPNLVFIILGVIAIIVGLSIIKIVGKLISIIILIAGLLFVFYGILDIDIIGIISSYFS